jgi:hypothetical protein
MHKSEAHTDLGTDAVRCARPAHITGPESALQALESTPQSLAPLRPTADGEREDDGRGWLGGTF